MSWAKHYRDRVNNEVYFDKFMNRYSPFLKFIDILCYKNPHYSYCEVGCGIGNVLKGISKLNPEFIDQYKRGINLYDASHDMLELAKKNLEHIPLVNRFVIYDVIFAQGSFVENSICITHGVLEHFTDDDIIQSVKKMGFGVHYVPLGGPKGYSEPSYGDERLLPKEHWIRLLNLRDWFTFNDEKDFAFYIPKNY